MKITIVTVATALMMVTSAFAQIGSTTTDLVYTTVTPCRLFDTRVSEGGSGPIAATGTKHFKIWGQTSYATQGGATSNCGLTAGINTAAVAMNLTVVGPASGGYITAYPFSTLLPTAATVNFVAGDIVRGNFTIARVSQAGGLFDLSIFSTSQLDVVGDVVGYYSKLASTALQCVNVKNTTATVVAVSSSVSVLDSAIAACPATHTGMSYIWQFTGSGNGGVAVWNNDYGTQIGLSHAPYTTTGNTNLSLFLGRRCCRIP